MNENHKEIRVELRAKNNRLWKAIHKKHESIASFCREYNLSFQHVGLLINLKISPFSIRNKTLGLTTIAMRLSIICEKSPETLFPKDLYNKYRITSKVLEVSIKEARFLVSDNISHDPSLLMDRINTSEIVQKALETITEREKDIIKRRFSIETKEPNQTLESIAKVYNLSRDRIRQIEAKAIRKLRNSNISNKLRTL